MQISKEQYFKLPERLQKYFFTQNIHCTVKPVKLMEYLIKLITPKNGIVLDLFCGSGTTLVAAEKLGFNYIGIELELEYCEIAEARVKYFKTNKEQISTKKTSNNFINKEQNKEIKIESNKLF